MNTSSFIGGVLIGAAATTLLSKNRGSIISSAMNGRHKMMDLASLAMNPANSHHQSAASGTQTSAYSKESSINQIQDFIRSNPEVKQEVDSILKETNTVIPGL